jgi:hypothetical protein
MTTTRNVQVYVRLRPDDIDEQDAVAVVEALNETSCRVQGLPDALDFDGVRVVRERYCDPVRV